MLTTEGAGVCGPLGADRVQVIIADEVVTNVKTSKNRIRSRVVIQFSAG